jgi:hypothetical protein
VAGELLEVLAVGDELVGGVDLAELAAAAAPDQQVHDDRGAGHGLAAAQVVARQAEGAEQVVAPQQLLAQAAVEVAAQEAGGHEEHADAAGHEQVERAAHEVRVGALLLVKFVGVLAGHLAALAVGRVGDDRLIVP